MRTEIRRLSAGRLRTHLSQKYQMDDEISGQQFARQSDGYVSQGIDCHLQKASGVTSNSLSRMLRGLKSDGFPSRERHPFYVSEASNQLRTYG